MNGGRGGVFGAHAWLEDLSILAYWGRKLWNSRKLIRGDGEVLKSLSMTGVGPAPEMSIEFAPRLNVLTGDNGLGKSFLLDMAWRALTQNWARGVMPLPKLSIHGPRDARISYWNETGTNQATRSHLDFVAFEYEWKETFPVRSEGVVIYAGADGDFLVSDLARITAASFERKDGFEEQGVLHLTPEQLLRGKSGNDGKRYCNGLIQDWVSWQKSDDIAFADLTRVLEELSPSATEILRSGAPTYIGVEDETEYPTIEMPYGTAIPIIHASAGIRRIAALAYILVWTWKSHVRASGQRGRPPTGEVTLLIDEVESHLHPQWQRRVVPALLRVMGAMKLDVAVQLILATHSPLVLV